MANQQGNMGGRRGGNLWVVALCLTAVFGMLGASYAAVPLYRIFCQVTGYGGTIRAAENSEGIPIVDRDITVRFDANVAPTLDWKFYPEKRAVTLKLGEVKTAYYYVENNSDRVLRGSATFNVSPEHMGAYFNKLECFCFTKTEVKPHEKLKMAVVFFVDPDMVNGEETHNTRTVTLSYTFFPSADDGTPIETSRSDARNRPSGS